MHLHGCIHRPCQVCAAAYVSPYSRMCPAFARRLCGLQVRQPALRLEEAGGQLMGSLVELLDGEEVALRWQ